ncbi:hypothetical protein QTI31_15345 [Clostridium perfringens]|uniref:DUF5678 domain-containing protein n=1 Tax=Clostridium perfringens TaxID=1502 RepID=A0AAW9K236_CLOPF|nr:hypothetical protein [Clostridium perfringens]MDK0900023.1 hypothetical protein [Clostridium perfringens]MDM0795897.1 hypothetical protein [Clostridium perfringens]MDM0959083.1 hypothetical protein [Clostridium perfringens]MDM0998958.1 hypothetical protein [Clostridium perfringens]MDZ7542277.1 hypothetical protein [Clostridium perfringens]
MNDKEKLMYKIEFQLKKNSKNNENEIWVVLNNNLKKIFLGDADYFLGETSKLLGKKCDYELISDLADRPILIIKFL